MFQIIGAMAEFKRALIQERVRAGMRNARAKGTRLGRPPVLVNTSELARLRADGWGWKRIAKHMGLGVSTVLRAMDGCHPRKGTEKVSVPMSAIASSPTGITALRGSAINSFESPARNDRESREWEAIQ